MREIEKRARRRLPLAFFSPRFPFPAAGGLFSPCCIRHARHYKRIERRGKGSFCERERGTKTCFADGGRLGFEIVRLGMKREFISSYVRVLFREVGACAGEIEGEREEFCVRVFGVTIYA